MVDTETIAGLMVGYFGGQFLGNLVESKLKPGVVSTSTKTDKIVAGVSNDGAKVALAYGAYTVGRSPFLRNVAWGSTLAAVVDAGWRYTHDGVPYGYKPFDIPLLGDINKVIYGQGHTESELSELKSLGLDSLNSYDNINISSLMVSDSDSIDDIIDKGRKLLNIRKSKSLSDSSLSDSSNTYIDQTPAPGTSEGDITPSPLKDPAAPVEDEYMKSIIPNVKSRFAFMGDKRLKYFGFSLGSPTSGREKYFGMII